jgi:branched-chain amino acid transport system substrate-binding protein
MHAKCLKLRARPFLVLSAGLSLAFAAVPASWAQDSVKIGMVGPLTGAFASMGQSQVSGAEMRADELNKAGGRAKITLLSEDDNSDCNQSANATVKLITQGRVMAIIGADNSPCALAMVPLTQRYKVPQFTFGVGSAITQQDSHYVFRVAPAAPQQTKALANFVVNTLKKKRIAIMYSDDEYGASMANGLKQGLADLGLQPVASEVFPRGDQDFTGTLSTIKRAEPDALFTTGSYTASALIAKQAKQLGLNVQILGDTGNATPKYAELGGSAVEGAVLVQPFAPTDPNPKIQDFVAKFKAKYNRVPDGWSAEIYDVVGMISDAVAASGKADAESVRAHVATFTPDKPYQGVLGAWSFDARGDATFPLKFIQIKDGQNVLLGP